MNRPVAKHSTGSRLSSTPSSATIAALSVRRRTRVTTRSNQRRRNDARSSPPIVRLPNMPPPLSINANIGTHWIRNYVTVDAKIDFVDNIGSDVFFSDTSYSSVYGEYRIKRVNVWYIPQTAVVTTPGDYAFSVIDSGQVKSAGEFKTIALMPGSTIRRLHQPAHGSWFPTEPSDKEWRPFDNKWSIFCVRIATTGTNKIDGYCVYDAHVSFRATAAALKESTPTASALAPSASDDSSSLEGRIKHLEAMLRGVTLLYPDPDTHVQPNEGSHT